MNLYKVMINTLAKYISICMLVSSIFLSLYGLYLIIEGIIAFYKVVFLHHDSRIVLFFVEAIDIFLISLVFLIFGLGVNILFSDDAEKRMTLPGWLSINSFSQLKILLIETVVASTFVFFISFLVRQNSEVLEWEVLVLPISIFFLSVSLFLFRKNKE